MPELPEVETVVRALRPHLLGRTITRVEIHTGKLRQPLEAVRLRRARHTRILDVRRRAKYIIVELSGRRAVLLHLGMTGSFRICSPTEPRQKHEHVLWHLDNGMTWRFADARRFGHVEIVRLEREGALPRAMTDLPPEPLGPDFDDAYLTCACRGRRRAIKTLLMDHTIVAGLGNIYASEALFRAGIRPRRAAGGLTRAERARLRVAIRQVLTEAIAAGGTTTVNFRSVDGSEGKFRVQLYVYDRAGQPCRLCRQATIKRLVLSGRSTYYCPRCQR